MTEEIVLKTKLFKALAAAQKEMRPIVRDATNPFFKSKYAPLEAVTGYVLPLLGAHGLSITQTTRIVGDNLVMITWLSHESGEQIFGEWPICAINKKPQEIGSATTYTRRYSIMAISGLASCDEDDDGNEAQAAAAAKKAPQKPAKSVSANEDVKAKLIGEIKAFAARLTKGFANDEKAEFMNRVIGVSDFRQVSSMDTLALGEILKNLAVENANPKNSNAEPPA